jgi:hypothetical protein
MDAYTYPQAAVASGTASVLTEGQLEPILDDTHEPLSRLVAAPRRVEMQGGEGSGGLAGFSREGGGGEYAVVMLQVSSSALEQLWQVVLPSLLQLVVPHVQAAHLRAAAAAATAVSSAAPPANGTATGDEAHAREAGGEGGAASAAGAGGAPLSGHKAPAGKETLKAVLLALWHWLHLIIAPGALAPLPPIALAACSHDVWPAPAAGGGVPRFPAGVCVCVCLGKGAVCAWEGGRLHYWFLASSHGLAPCLRLLPP